MKTNDNSIDFKKAAGIYARVGLSLEIVNLQVVFDKNLATSTKASSGETSMDVQTF